MPLKLEVKSLEHKGKSLSGDEKMKEQNRIRQIAFKVRQKMPKDYDSFCKVAEHLVKNAHRYKKLENAEEVGNEFLFKVKNEEMSPEIKKENLSCDEQKATDIVNSAIKLEESGDPCKDANKMLREIKALKGQNRLTEQQECVRKLKEKVDSYRDISKTTGIPLKTVHDWCSVSRECKHKGTERANLKKEEFRNFWMQDTITYSHPGKRFANKKFLIHTWDELHKRYVQQPEFHQHGMISKTTMRGYKPKCILLSGKTPVNQCLCDHCENINLIIRALVARGLKNVPSNKYNCLDSTFCSIRNGQFGTSYSFAPKACIRRTCSNCGVQKLRDMIETNKCNQELLKTNKTLTWHRWQIVEGKSSPMKQEIKGTLRSAVNEFLTIVKDLSAHLFRANWNRNVFQYLRSNLMEGCVLQVLDFAMNFNN